MTKFNLKRCVNCEYSMGEYQCKEGDTATKNKIKIHCGYSLKTGETCLKRNGTDIRGEGFNNCQKYIEKEK